MSRASGFSLPAFIVCTGVALLLAGCSSSRQSTSSTSETSSSGEEAFPTPDGWLNFSADSSRNTLAWFVRDDYGAEIIIEAITGGSTDGTPSVNVKQLTALTRAVFSMDTVNGEKVLQRPVRDRSGGNDRWTYILQNDAGDRLRVVITASERFGALRSATTVLADQRLAEVARVQDALLSGPVP
ncbi:MAG: hypothetical protein WB699_01300 [Bacteroidota bacterium]